jgi:predicted DNA-binding transcriptional regulator YafY
MSKKHYFTRYLLIVRKLQQQNFVSFSEIQDYLTQRLPESNEYSASSIQPISRRTLQRDLKDIYEIFGVDIQFCFRNKGYYLADSGFQSPLFERLAESFEVISTLQLGKEILPFVFLEERKPRGTEYLLPLLSAIRAGKTVNFIYQKFSDEPERERNTIPCGLKEFRNRWYLIAIDSEDDILKSFGLDRMRRINTGPKTNRKINRQIIIDHYSNSFGIIGPNEEPPDKVTLRFSPSQAPYIKTLPLHSSQQIIEHSEAGCIVQLCVHLSHDFIMELLSFGETLTVLEPESLRKQMSKLLEKALTNYKTRP